MLLDIAIPVLGVRRTSVGPVLTCTALLLTDDLQQRFGTLSFHCNSSLSPLTLGVVSDYDPPFVGTSLLHDDLGMHFVGDRSSR